MRKLFLLVICTTVLLSGNAFAQADIRPILAKCIQYFDNGNSPRFMVQQDFYTSFDLPELVTSTTEPEMSGGMDTVPAALGITSENQDDCQMWNWVHISDVFVPTLVVLPESDATTGHHFNGDVDTKPVSYCPQSSVTYAVFGRDLNGNIAVLSAGIKYGTVDGPGPCNGQYYTSAAPCNAQGSVCGNNYAVIDGGFYQEVWIGVLSWSHDQDHFYGADPYSNVWWNSMLSYQLRF